MKNYEELIKKSRDENFDDYQIFNKLKEQPEIKEKYAESEKLGVNVKEIDKYVSEKYGLKPEKPKTFLQQAFGALSADPISYGLEKAIGKNAVSDSIRETKRALTTSLPAAVLALPRAIIEAPGNMVQASEDYWKDKPKSKPWSEDLIGNPDSEGINLIRGITDPIGKALDWGLENTGIKGAAQKYLPNFEESSEYFRHESDAPKTGAGQFTERATAGGVGGPAGALIGGLDYLAEQADIPPEYRLLMGLGLGKANKKGPKTIYGKILPKEPITSPNDLGARLLTYNKESLNIPVLKAAAELNFPVENIPLQALYKNGLPNLMEGITQNSFFGEKRFNDLLDSFTTDMSDRVNQVVDSMPIDVGANQITDVTSIGERTFQNPLPILLQSAALPLNISKHETGKIGTNAIQSFDKDLKSQYKALYDNVKFKKNDLIEPSDGEYHELLKTINHVNKTLKSKGYQGKQRVEALDVLSKVRSLFKLNEEIDPVTGEIKKSLPDIKLEDVRKNLVDLNDTLSYDSPKLVNVLEPISNFMRTILHNAGQTKPHLKDLSKANQIFKQRADVLKDPLMKKLSSMTDEQFYRTVKNNPSYLKKFIEFATKTGQVGALNKLKGQLMSDVLEAPLKAENPKDLASSINSTLLKNVRELEPIYPELKDLSTSLQLAKRTAERFSSPDEMIKSQTRQTIMSDVLSNSDFNDTLKIMNNPKGIDLVRDTLRTTPQGKSLLKSLEKKKVEEALYKGPKKQEINLAELGEVFKNLKTDAILKKLLSTENYNAAKQLSKIAEEYEKGIKSHQSLKHLGEKGVGLGAIGAFIYSPIPTVIAVGTLAQYMLSKNFRKLMIDNMQRKFKDTQSPNP